ncbi:MAG: hypothetical protein AVDCRST_MAG89-1236 [uncultured Gemmatimonadetes bacterium]|uniref:DUF4160 domain-containing protein n=1 Tax=uncultured Gemmatimonadota bacterium TaxID=203437 RepID=A0A6J4KQX9_9BACT|nr:MAG: hypothetical protein AVDCRST_MAG89-1236 [uncultured Gemmatimonadota bacterium]
MGTVHRESGFTFRIWPNDHRPPHVHVRKGGEVALINLSPVSVRDRRTMKLRNLGSAVELVHRNAESLLSKWEDLHGA